MIRTVVAFSLLVTLLSTLTSSLKLGRVSRQKLTVDTKMKKTESDAVIWVTEGINDVILNYFNIFRLEVVL